MVDLQAIKQLLEDLLVSVQELHAIVTLDADGDEQPGMLERRAMTVISSIEDDDDWPDHVDGMDPR